jgi:hypothetical protein
MYLTSLFNAMPDHINIFPNPGTFYNNEEVSVAVHEWLLVSNRDGEASNYVNSDKYINVPANWARKLVILLWNK